MKLKKFRLGNLSEKMPDSKLKRIFGGGYNGPYCCAYNTDGGAGGTCIAFGGSPTEAEFMAGPNGWWGCNTDEIWLNCCN